MSSWRQQKQASYTLERIIAIIKIIQPTSTRDIKAEVDRQNIEINKKLKSSGNLKGPERKLYSGPSLRHIQRVVKALARESMLQRKKGLYSLSEWALSQSKYYPQRFGTIC